MADYRDNYGYPHPSIPLHAHPDVRVHAHAHREQRERVGGDVCRGRIHCYTLCGTQTSLEILSFSPST